MILAIDCGNSRIKWGWCASPEERSSKALHWIGRGALDLADIACLPGEWTFNGVPSSIVVSNVAGKAVQASLLSALDRFAAKPHWIVANSQAGGVTNGYADPQQLGADRWSALIGARALHSGDCLVVMAGTATTVDVLGADGEFRGGLILPGVQLMKRALASHTAGLALCVGEVVELPRNTANAIETGCLVAQVGAIERMFLQLRTDPLCVLSGGAALPIAEKLNIPFRVVDNLVLEGLVRLTPRYDVSG